MSENKKYKFSEIITMLEEKTIEEGTIIERDNGLAGIKKLIVEENSEGKLGLNNPNEESIQVRTFINIYDINYLWTIKSNELYYLVAPDCFGLNKVLNYNTGTGEYFLSEADENSEIKTQFTQKEIDKMTFNIGFFDPVKVADFKLK